jgi:RHS repeat-associated protein
MVKVREHLYDGGQVGDSNLTKVTEFPGGTAAARVTQSFFDWRDRLVATKQGVQTTEGTGTQRPILYQEYDNLSQVVAVSQYDGDTVTMSDANGDGVPDKPAAGLLRAYQTGAYDDQGRVFRRHVFSVDPATGAVSPTSLTTGLWYSHRGQLIKTSEPGGLVSKTTYDGPGRVSFTFQTDGGGDSAWSDADDVSGDVVLRQEERGYDSNGNLIRLYTKERFHDEIATGALGNPTSAPKARVSYQVFYYGRSDRLADVVDVGTNGGQVYNRPPNVPARSDTVLVTSLRYNEAGWLSSVYDPRNLRRKTFFDDLGRPIEVIETYTGGSPTPHQNRTTRYTYDGNSNVLTVTAYGGASGSQTTEFVFGVSTATGSDIHSNDILAAIKHPHPTSGGASNAHKEVFTVNALGEPKTRTDRNGTIRQFSYDVVGRPTEDAVTFLDSGVDGQVMKRTTGYDTAGRPELFTSYNASDVVVNQVQRVYNGLGQLVTEYQAVAGAVNPSLTPKVQYAYSAMAGGANHSRLTGLTYPNGRMLNLNYATGLDDRISRLSSLSDTSGTLEAYAYLGLDTVVTRAHAQPGVDLTYVKRTGEANGEAGDPYTGLDRFGRVVDQRWLVSATGVATDRFAYGYDRNSNRLYRDNLVNAAFGELYTTDQGLYTGLNQMRAFQRGVLSDGNGDGRPDTVASPSRDQFWDFDVFGNWSNLTTDGVGQPRTHNLQNEITSVSGQSTPGYDSNGNMTADQTGKTLVFDAWDRLVQISAGGVTIVSYAHDALGRRVSENAGTLRELYYSAGWQVLEERQGGQAKVQQVWSPVYVDALVLRDRDADGNGTLEERLYVQQDANFNVTALVSAAGAVQERYLYDPYGQPSVLAPDWTTRVNSLFAWNYLHQGGRHDGGSGLYHFRNREYSPTLGRWLQEDPIGLVADSNLYRYVDNNPTGQLDPLGLFPSNIELCRSIKKKIHNIQDQIAKRKKELLEDKLKLPEHCPGDINNPALSREGHRRIIGQLKKHLEKYINIYKARCQDPEPNGPSRPLPPTGVGVLPKSEPMQPPPAAPPPSDGFGLLPTSEPVPFPPLQLPLELPLRILLPPPASAPIEPRPAPPIHIVPPDHWRLRPPSTPLIPYIIGWPAARPVATPASLPSSVRPAAGFVPFFLFPSQMPQDGA